MSAPIFVVGPPRSGTSLMAKILGKHSRIFMPGETHFFDDIYARRKELGEPRDPQAMERIIVRLSTLYGRYTQPGSQEKIAKLFSDPAVLEELKTSCRNYRDILSFFMGMQMYHEGKARWGNHVPKDIFNLREILLFYPNAKILVCVRDVRDFALSYCYQWRARARKQQHRLQRLYHPIVTSLLWKASVKQIAVIKLHMPGDNLMVVRYESLVHNPVEVVRHICTFIGEEFEDRMLEVDTHNSSFEVQGSGIFSSSVGNWRAELSAEEVYLTQRITRRELEELGYPLACVKVNPLRLAYIVTTLPYALWRALDANKMVRGPLIPYFIRRVAAIIHK